MFFRKHSGGKRNLIKKTALWAASLVMLAVLALSAGCGRQAYTPPGAVAVTGERAAQIQALDRTAEELYRLTLSGSVVEARNRLNQLARLVTKTNFEGVTSLAGVHALSEAILQGERTYNSAAYSRQAGLQAAGTIRLITDALTHSNEPMWHQHYKPVKDDVAQLKKAALRKDASETAAAFERLYRHYRLFRPAAIVKHEPYEIEKLDSLFVFLKKRILSDAWQSSEFSDGLDRLDESFDELFGRKEDRTAYLPWSETDEPIYWTIVLGAVLVSSLGYVAVKMFHSDKRLARVRRKDEL